MLRDAYFDSIISTFVRALNIYHHFLSRTQHRRRLIYKTIAVKIPAEMDFTLETAILDTITACECARVCAPGRICLLCFSGKCLAQAQRCSSANKCNFLLQPRAAFNPSGSRARESVAPFHPILMKNAEFYHSTVRVNNAESIHISVLGRCC